MSNELIKVDLYELAWDELYKCNTHKVYLRDHLGVAYISRYLEPIYDGIMKELQTSFGQQSLFFAAQIEWVPSMLVPSQPMSPKTFLLVESLAKRLRFPMAEIAMTTNYCFAHFTDAEQAFGLEAILQTTLISSCRLFIIEEINS